MNEGYIYVVGSGALGDPVKIGWSRTPEKRVRQLQTGSPQALRLLHKHPGPKDLEAFLHAEFADLRMQGEWFRIEEPVVSVRNAVRFWMDAPVVSEGIDPGVLRSLLGLTHPQMRIMIFYLTTAKSVESHQAVVLTGEKIAEEIGMNRPLLARTLPYLVEMGWLSKASRCGNVWHYGLGPRAQPRHKRRSPVGS